ncbi:MAG TPA: DUF4331 family protein [Longimicrobiaceae bacterium]|nr:DUF4331 family protein [Longimicrobiaceae bacterium]
MSHSKQGKSKMRILKKAATFAAVFALAALGAACDGEDTRTLVEVQKPDTVRITIRDTVRVGNQRLVFNQIERLGNPLVSEVTLEKRLHSFYNTTNPRTDVRFFKDDVKGFITGVAGRDPAYAEAVASALLPDMLAVFPNRAAGVTAANADDSALVGWLTHVLAPNNTGYGGRKLDNDDAVDKGLSVIFGAALGNMNNVSPGLTTDNVPDPQQDPNTFPYVAPPL